MTSPYAELSPDRLDALARRREAARTSDPLVADQRVVAVLVVHDGMAWLPTALEALSRLTVAPEVLVAVDVGSRDGSADLLAVQADDVVRVDRGSPFGASVAMGWAAGRELAGIGPADAAWLWVLHDDCAPEPDALEALLRQARRHDADVVAPKVVDWFDPGIVLEVGVSIAGNGARVVGVDAGERDVGQFDTRTGVLAAGSAGALVSANAWALLGGFDPQLTFFREDVDFGWRAHAADLRVVAAPAARVRHVQAAARGERRLGTGEDPLLLDRRHGSSVVLDNTAGLLTPLVLLRLVWGSLLRSVLWVVGKAPRGAAMELRALGFVLNPRRARPARRARRQRRRVPRSAYSPLFPGVEATVRHATEELRRLRRGEAATVLVPHEEEDAAAGEIPAGQQRQNGDDDGRAGRRRRRLPARPGVVLIGTLTLAALVVNRDLLGPEGVTGGALLPSPSGASDLFATYVASWHAVGLGDPTPAPPWVGILALASGLAWGNPARLVTWLLVLAVPLGAGAAWWSMRAVISSPLARGWAATTYGLLAATTGAVAAGQLGTIVALLLLPVALREVAVALGGPSRGLGHRRHAWSAGLALTVIVAFVPAVGLAVLLSCLVAAVVATTRRRVPGEPVIASALAHVAVIAGLPMLLLLPWSLEVVREPDRLATGFGMPGPGLSDSDVGAVRLLLLDPGGLGAAPTGVLLGVTLMALLSSVLMLSPARVMRWVAVSGWGLALPAVLVGVVVSHTRVGIPSLAATYPGWAGGTVVLTATALLVVGAVGMERLVPAVRGRFSGVARLTSLGAVGLVAMLALAGSAAAAVAWVSPPGGGQLRVAGEDVLPPYVMAEAATSDRPRTVVVAPPPAPTGAEEARAVFTVLRERGSQLTDVPLGPPVPVTQPVGEAVSRLIAGQPDPAVSELDRRGIRYLMLAAPADVQAAEVLDATAGLERVSAADGAAMWRLPGAGRRAWVEGATEEVVPVPAGAVTIDTELPVGVSEAGARLVLAEVAHDGWTARLAGRALTPTLVDGWAQGFELPVGALPGDRLEVAHVSDRRYWVSGQVALVAIAVAMALPRAARRPTPASTETLPGEPSDGAP